MTTDTDKLQASTSAREALEIAAEICERVMPSYWNESIYAMPKVLACQEAADEIRALAAALPQAEVPVVWRYRYVATGVTSGRWKYADTEQECELSVFYERQPLYEARPATPKGEAGVPEPEVYPHRTAAFINAIADEGSKAEAIDELQKTWNELCWVRALLAASEGDQNNAGINSVAGLAESQALAPSGSSNRGVAPTASAPSPAPACPAAPKGKP